MLPIDGYMVNDTPIKDILQWGFIKAEKTCVKLKLVFFVELQWCSWEFGDIHKIVSFCYDEYFSRFWENMRGKFHKMLSGETFYNNPIDYWQLKTDVYGIFVHVFHSFFRKDGFIRWGKETITKIFRIWELYVLAGCLING